MHKDKLFKLISSMKMQIKPTMGYLFKPCRLKIRKLDDANCYQGLRTLGVRTLVHCEWE